jgi:hypothetical protein
MAVAAGRGGAARRATVVRTARARRPAAARNERRWRKVRGRFRTPAWKK